MKKRIKLTWIGLIVFFAFVVFGWFLGSTLNKLETKNEKKEVQVEKVNVNDYYNNYVITTSEIDVFSIVNGEFIKVGKINNNVELELDGIVNDYFKLKGFFDEYYISYKNLNKIDSVTILDERYKKYVPFKEKIVTNDITNFYDENNNLVYSFNKSFEFGILIKDYDRYGIIFNEKLFYINKDDVKDTIYDDDIGGSNTEGIAVLNYHFFYNDKVSGEYDKCNQIICSSLTQFRSHLDYIKNNGFFTPTMKELEMYIDGKIMLPKSVVITIDDGWRAVMGIELLTEYKLNATMFLVTSWYDVKKFKTDYVEVHSHTHDMHNAGDCPSGQGGGIQCLDEEFILNDLKTSSEKLNGSKVFCYPFYEYNDYSISMLKKAGYTMAFAGQSYINNNLVKVGSNKYKLPRFVIYSYTTVDNLKNYLN